MSAPTEGFFDELGRRGHEPLLENVSGSIRFDLDHDNQTDHWFVNVTNGDVSVSTKNVKADSVIHTDKRLFDRIVEGQANTMAALLRGLIGVEGNRELVARFQRVFPGPARASDKPTGQRKSVRQSESARQSESVRQGQRP
jgi:putative sterol carrier protein